MEISSDAILGWPLRYVAGPPPRDCDASCELVCVLCQARVSAIDGNIADRVARWLHCQKNMLRIADTAVYRQHFPGLPTDV